MRSNKTILLVLAIFAAGCPRVLANPVLALSASTPSSAESGDPDLPQLGVVTTRPSNWNATADHTPADQAALLELLDGDGSGDVAAGEVIQLTATTDYGEIVIDEQIKGGSENWIVIRSGDGTNFPEGTRITTGDIANMAIFSTDGNATSDRALRISPSEDGSTGGASYIWLIGVLIENDNTQDMTGTHVSNLTTVGIDSTGPIENVNDACEYIMFDECIWRGQSATQSPINNVMWLDGNYIGVINSRVYNCQGNASDGANIRLWTGGPLHFENNYLSMSGINIIFGGNSTSISIPHDVTIKRNHFHKDSANWETAGYAVKNMIESKFSIRTLIEANVFENGWLDEQPCAAYYAKNGGDGSVPTDTTSHVTFRNNLVKDGYYCLRVTNPIVGSDNPSYILFENNLYYNMDRTGDFDGAASFVRVRNNTFVVNAGGSRHPDLKSSAGWSDCVFKDNIFSTPTEHFRKDGVAAGTATLNSAFTGSYTLINNLFQGATIAAFNTGAEGGSTAENNAAPADQSAIGFNNVGANDYSLGGGSSYLTASSTGGEPGADIDAINSAITGVEE